MSYQHIKYSCFRNEETVDLFKTKHKKPQSLRGARAQQKMSGLQGSCTAATKPKETTKDAWDPVRPEHQSLCCEAPAFHFKYGETSNVLLKTKKKAQKQAGVEKDKEKEKQGKQVTQSQVIC